MKEIKPVTMFICPVTGKPFKTKAAAEKSALKEQKVIDAANQAERFAQIQNDKRVLYSNYIRLNLADVNDLPRMLKEKAREFFDIEIRAISINVSFGDVDCTHSAPIDKSTNWSRTAGKPTSYLGWAGKIKATANCARLEKAAGFGNSINTGLFNNGFRGLHTSTGCGGSFGKYDMDIGFYFFMDDFPLLAAKYQTFVEEKEKFDKNIRNIDNAKYEARRFALTHPEVVELNERINELTKKRDELELLFFKEYENSNPPIVEPHADEWEFLKTQFSNYSSNWSYGG